MHQPQDTGRRRPAWHSRGRARSAAVVALALLAAGVVAKPSTGADGGTTGNLGAAVARVATLPEGTAGMAADYDSDTDAVYVLGGYGASCGTTCTTKSLTDEVLHYDPYLDRFDPAPALVDSNGDPVHLALAAHVDVPGHGIYLFGGVRLGGTGREVSCSGACPVSNAILRYDPETGETTTLAATLPTARDRAAAVYDPDTGLVYVVGGETTDAGLGSAVNQLLAFDPVTQQLVGNPVTLPAHGYYIAAGYIPYTRPEGDSAVGGFVHPGPKDHGFLELEATQGIVEYYPTSTDLPNYYDFGINHEVQVGSAWAYAAGKQEIVTIGGRCSDGAGCPSTYTTYAQGRGPLIAETVAAQLPVGSESPPGNVSDRSQIDGAATYVPTLDRMVSFGGFMGVNPSTWTDTPSGPQFRDVVYSISPTYPGVLAPAPLPVDSPALVAGQPATVEVQQTNPPQPVTIGVQTSYRPTGQDDEVETRALPSTTAPTADPSISDVTFTVPKDLTPGSDERAAGLCVMLTETDGPQNCREVVLTTNPGTLDLTISGTSPATGTQPLTRATVRLLDRDGHQVDEQTLDASTTTYHDGALATGTYTVQVWREFAHGDTVLYLPTSVQSKVSAGKVSNGAVTLKGTATLGPVAKSVTADHDALPAQAVGTFLAFPVGASYAPRVPVTFTANGLVEPFADPLDGGYHTASVDFSVNGTTVTDTGGADGWSATLDMSKVLRPGNNTLHVTAKDDAPSPHVGPSYDVTIVALAAKPLDKTFNPSVTWDPTAQKYSASFILPGRPRMRWPSNPPAVTDLKLFKLYSQLRADVELDEQYTIDGKWQASGDGAVLAQFLSTAPDRYNLAYPFTVTPTYAPDGGIDSYTMTTDIDVCHALQSGEANVERTVGYMRALTDPTYYLTKQQNLFPCNQWMPVFGGNLIDWPHIAKLRVTVDLKVGAHFLLQGTIDGSTYGVRSVRAIPQPDAALRFAAELDLLSGTISGGAWAAADVFAQQPIVYSSSHNPVLYVDNPCLRLLVTGGIWVETPLGKSTYGPKTIVDEQAPHNCFVSATTTNGGASLTTRASRFTPPRVMAEPATATDPATGGGALRLWVEDADPTGVPVPRLHFSSGSALGTVSTAGAQTDPAVAFTGDHHAIAVWSQTTLTKKQAAAMSPWAIARHQEIDTATWDGAHWSAPTALTKNSINDGRAVVTSPGDGSATVAWVRDTDGNPGTKGDWEILTRHWDGNRWAGAVAQGASDGAADLEPAMATAPDASTWLVWTHDGDGDFTTNGDRRVRYAVLDPATSTWSAPVQPASWPAGALTPSLVFSPMSNRPLVTMAVIASMQRAPDATTARPAGVGTEGLLYAAWGAPGLGADTWDVQQIGNTDPSNRTDDPRVEWAQAMLLPGASDIAVVVAREFGGDGITPGGGQAAAVEADLGTTSARWATPSSLTRGAKMAWQIDASGGLSDQQTTLDLVGVTTSAPTQPTTHVRRASVLPQSAVPGAHRTVLATSPSGGVFGLTENTTGTDLAISGITLSDDTPAPGEDVEVTVAVVNPDLQPVSTAMGGTPSFDVDLYRRQDTCPSPAERTDFGRAGTQTVSSDLLFGERVPLTFHVTATGAPEHVLACLYFDAETSLGPPNNSAVASFGSLPEVIGGKAGRRPQGSVTVHWLAETTSPADPVGYRVFRATSSAGPWMLAGTTAGTVFTDITPGGATFYRVEAFDARGLVSPGGGAVAVNSVATDLTTAGTRSGTGDRVRGNLTPADVRGTVHLTLFVKRSGAFVLLRSKDVTLGAATDANGDGVPVSGYSTTFTRPSGTTCKVTARYTGDATHLGSSAADTFSC